MRRRAQKKHGFVNGMRLSVERIRYGIEWTAPTRAFLERFYAAFRLPRHLRTGALLA